MKEPFEKTTKLNREDVFSPEELFLLAGSEQLHQVHSAVVDRYAKDQEAQIALLDKKLIDEKGALTEDGFYVSHIMHQYADALSYERINRYTFTVHPKFKDKLIVLADLKDNRYYQLRVLSNTTFLELLLFEYPVLGRYRSVLDSGLEAVEDEKKARLLKEKITDLADYTELETASAAALAFPKEITFPIETAVFFTESSRLLYYNLKTQSLYYANAGILNAIVLSSLGFRIEQMKEVFTDE